MNTAARRAQSVLHVCVGRVLFSPSQTPVMAWTTTKRPTVAPVVTVTCLTLRAVVARLSHSPHPFGQMRAFVAPQTSHSSADGASQRRSHQRYRRVCQRIRHAVVVSAMTISMFSLARTAMYSAAKSGVASGFSSVINAQATYVRRPMQSRGVSPLAFSSKRIDTIVSLAASVTGHKADVAITSPALRPSAADPSRPPSDPHPPLAAARRRSPP